MLNFLPTGPRTKAEISVRSGNAPAPTQIDTVARLEKFSASAMQMLTERQVMPFVTMINLPN